MEHRMQILVCAFGERGGHVDFKRFYRGPGPSKGAPFSFYRWESWDPKRGRVQDQMAWVKTWRQISWKQFYYLFCLGLLENTYHQILGQTLNLKFSLKHNILHLLLKGQNQSSRFSRGNTDPSTCPSASLSEHSSKPKSLNRCIHAHIHMCSLRRPSLPLISGLFSLTWKPHRPGGYPDCHFCSINGR